ncbi:TetR/AcrR family transcriptional regulator [Mycobacteroides abscessus]|nr:TetR/AcrR family transcriptional regulator [Mycobacteroides abscessus]SKT94196.1 TetR family transcriptional regulator [Mycobacteroides abscessus subsp. massiliense]SKU20261.1 TetR family transcriptional regulator [Mycobacteroides abscessus subsp. massiliense]
MGRSDMTESVSVDQILDAAVTLYSVRGPSEVSMDDIADACGCQRNTLERYFASLELLQLAYAGREAMRLADVVAARTEDIADPAERLAEAVLTTLHRVRSTPALASWVNSGDHDLILEISRSAQVTDALTKRYLPAVVDSETRAEWLVRSILSLLLDPASDAARERTLITDFLVPALLGQG